MPGHATATGTASTSGAASLAGSVALAAGIENEGGSFATAGHGSAGSVALAAGTGNEAQVNKNDDEEHCFLKYFDFG